MRTLGLLCILAAAIVAGAGQARAQEDGNLNLVFSCSPDNDLYEALTSGGRRVLRFDKPEEAIWFAPADAGILLLADRYPNETVMLGADMVDEAFKKRARLYIEYPESLPGVRCGSSRAATVERGVITSDWFGSKLGRMSLLTIHDCHFVSVDAVAPHITLAKVAGYDKAAYPLPEWVTPRSPECRAFPVLVKHPLGPILIASTKLSGFVEGRYGPMESWRTVWEGILEWAAGKPVRLHDWNPSVQPTYDRSTFVPKEAGKQVMQRAARWYFNAHMLIHPDWQDKVVKAGTEAGGIGRAPDPEWPSGDGKLGVLEGFSSIIGWDGQQPVRYVVRTDCTSEAAMALAFDSVVSKDARSRETAVNLEDFVCFESASAQGTRSDEKSPSYGLLSWDQGASTGVYYGDDNARAMLGLMGSAALLETNRWDDRLLRALLANLRTTGAKGFRGARIDEEQLQQNGWRYYWNAETVHLAPHYEAYLWATFLWAYRQTGHAPFLERAKAGIAATMEAYPDNWSWTNGIQQERARMLLPLAWLIRIEDDPQHRVWLNRIADDLLRAQDASGGIREELGPEGKGAFGPPKSNDEYGTGEGTIIHSNGDPACDLLYTTNFAFFGLHEAAKATGEDRLIQAGDRLADFLCRIQISSEKHPELDGAWYRAFDMKMWEYWGSNSDNGWGAWSIESGWTQGWIASVFGLRELDTSFWELTAKVDVKKHLDKLLPVMFPVEEAAPAVSPGPVDAETPPVEATEPAPEA